MNHFFNQAIDEVIALLPESPWELQAELSLRSPRGDETVPWISEYLEQLWFKIQDIFQSKWLDLFWDDPEISEFRHVQKGFLARINQPENSLNKDWKNSYRWTDVFRANARSLLTLE